MVGAIVVGVEVEAARCAATVPVTDECGCCC